MKGIKNPKIWFEFKDSFKKKYPQITATKGVIKLTVEVNVAPVSFINLKKINPPIAVLRIPNTIPKIILWLVGDAFIGSSKRKTNGSNIIQAK